MTTKVCERKKYIYIFPLICVFLNKKLEGKGSCHKIAKLKGKFKRTEPGINGSARLLWLKITVFWGELWVYTTLHTWSMWLYHGNSTLSKNLEHIHRVFRRSSLTYLTEGHTLQQQNHPNSLSTFDAGINPTSEYAFSTTAQCKFYSRHSYYDSEFVPLYCSLILSWATFLDRHWFETFDCR